MWALLTTGQITNSTMRNTRGGNGLGYRREHRDSGGISVITKKLALSRFEVPFSPGLRYSIIHHGAVSVEYNFD